MKRFALLFTLFFTSIQVFGYDFYYTYEGQTLSYTVIDEEAKTCQTKAGRVDDPGYGHVNIYNGNQASKDKDLYIPNTAKDKKTGREYTVIRIGELGFYNNSMSSVTIPNSVTEIESSAFRECKKLTSVNISNSVTSIGSDAFMDCSGLTSVNIPNSVTSIGDDAFSRCSGLKEVHVSDLDSWYNIDFYGSFSNPLAYAHNLYLNGELVTGIVIPENVTEIKNWAFSGCSELTSVTIPNSVTSIGSYAFSGCSELTSVTIPNSVTSIGRSAFSGCSELTSVNIPNSVTSIGNAAFKDCSGLTSVNIPNSVTEIENYAFSGCSGLKKLTIEDSSSTPPLYFSDDLFSDCPIETIYLGRNLSISFDSPFKDKETIISVTIGNSVTEICNVAFSGCSGLTSVTIPNSVTSIDHAAFSGCSGLSSLTIPNSVTSIDNKAFAGCSNLKELTLEDGSSTLSLSLGYFDDYSEFFSDCPIETIYLGRNLSYDYSPFMNKKTITSVTIGNSVTEIGESVFYGCENLTSVTIGDSVTEIGSSAFYHCWILRSVSLPNSVKKIGCSAFYGCQNMTSLTTGNSVSSIGSSAFYSCSGLTSVTIPNSVTEIDGSAFERCSNLKEVHISDLESWCNIDFYGSFSNPLSYAHNLYLNGELVTDIVIPQNVTEIKNYAFYGCSGLTSVTIPNSVTSIGSSAFSGCSGLKELTVEDGSSTLSLGNNDYYGLFSDCPIETIYLGRNLSYAYSPFKDKETIISVTIGNSVTEIVSSAFAGCSGLTLVNIPNSVTSIGGSAFAGCSGLTSVNIPNSVTLIGRSAFSGCSEVISIISDALNPPTIYETTFDKIVIYSAELFVQERAERAYKAEPIWGLFDIKVIEPVSSLTLSVTEWTGFDGESFSIEATILPENTTYKTVTWSSSDEAVATVDVYGNVVAIKEGKATITASCGALYATCTVNVKANGAGIESVEIESVKGENDIRVEGRSIIAPEGSYVYDLKGRRVHPNGLRPGIYIVRIPGAKTTKVLVK